MHQAGAHPLGAILTKLPGSASLYGYDAEYYYYGNDVDAPKLAKKPSVADVFTRVEITVSALMPLAGGAAPPSGVWSPEDNRV